MKGNRLLYLLVFLFLANLGLLIAYRYLPSFLQRYEQKLHCPVLPKYCSQGKVIEIDGRYFGIGYKLPTGSPIFAVSDGETRGGTLTFSYKLGGQRFPTIILRSKTGENEIDYILTGDDYRDIANVRQGDKISISGEGLIGNSDVNLVVRLRKVGGEAIPLGAKSLSAKRFIFF